MTPFIQKVIRDLPAKNGQDLSQLCIVFPNRRAGLFFKKYLSQELDQPVWAPEILGIREFVGRLTGLQFPPSLTLVIELYQAFREAGLEEDFDRFYPWGEMLIRDFDEIDKNMVNGYLLFENLLEIKKIEEAFGPDPAGLEWLKEFWGSFSDGGKAPLQKHFLRIWKLNQAVYPKYKKQLREKNLAYEGMAYRELAEALKKESALSLPWEKVIFCGLNALSRSEEQILKHLLEESRAEVYWDVDEYYLNDSKQEAGKFLRHNFEINLAPPSGRWIEENLANEGKNVNIWSVPLAVDQAKLLSQRLIQDKPDPEKTAVVLSDENLLMPLLYALPPEIPAVNVTMGYPLRNTPLFSLFDHLIRLHSEAGEEGGRVHFYHREVLHILRHPYIRNTDRSFPESIQREIIDKNLIFVDREKLKGQHELFSMLFTPVRKVDEVLPYLERVLSALGAQWSKEQSKPSAITHEIYYHFFIILNQLKEILDVYQLELSLPTFWKMLRQVVSSVSMPFTGEPLKGLQVMGMLETRNLDFENVYILSMNEGVLPAGKPQQSFIPYNIRKGFGLPTFEEDDALFSYYFYRLLQRAKNIHLFYTTQVKSLSQEEKSRLIRQVESEWTRKNPSLSLEYHHYGNDSRVFPAKEISIKRDEEVNKVLKKYLTGNDPVEKLSPSAVISYITCPLQFYFQRLAGLKEEEELTEDVDRQIFGNIFHDTIAWLYNDYWKYEGPEVTARGIEKMNESIEPHLMKAFEKHFLADGDKLRGRNILVKEIIAKQVKGILDRDKRDVPYRLVGLEERKWEADMALDHGTVRLSGIIDRIDEKDGIKRILDYKTGKIYYQGRAEINDYFSDEKNKTALQLLWYGYVYLKNHPGETISLGAYPVNKLGDRITYVGNNIRLEDLSNFEHLLRGVLNRIFFGSEPFDQTSDLSVCNYCPYNAICHRD